jgi:hypothetical protein
LPEEVFPQRRQMKLDSILYLEQTKTGKFSAHGLEQIRCDYLTASAGDLYGDGRIHLVTGTHSMNPDYAGSNALTIWENLGPRSSASSGK